MERVLKQDGRSTKKHGMITKKNMERVLKDHGKSTQTRWKEY